MKRAANVHPMKWRLATLLAAATVVVVPSTALANDRTAGLERAVSSRTLPSVADGSVASSERVVQRPALSRLATDLDQRLGSRERALFAQHGRVASRAPNSTRAAKSHDNIFLYAPADRSAWVWSSGGTLAFSWFTNWYCVACTGLQYLFVATDPGFANVVYESRGTCAPNSQPSCPSSDIVGGFAPGTYYWGVVVQFGSETHTSDAWSFQITRASGPPQPQQPPTPTVTIFKPLPTMGGPTTASRVDSRYSRIAGIIADTQAEAKCWGPTDWHALHTARVTYEGGNGLTFVAGFFVPGTNIVNLAPEVCARLDLLTYLRKRPTGFQTKRQVANAVTTLTHEAIHLQGVDDEAETECYAMQLTELVAAQLGVTRAYGFSLGRLVWLYDWPLQRGTEYWTARCYNGGPLDLFPGTAAWP